VDCEWLRLWLWLCFERNLWLWFRLYNYVDDLKLGFDFDFVQDFYNDSDFLFCSSCCLRPELIRFEFELLLQTRRQSLTIWHWLFDFHFLVLTFLLCLFDIDFLTSALTLTFDLGFLTLTFFLEFLTSTSWLWRFDFDFSTFYLIFFLRSTEFRSENLSVKRLSYAFTLFSSSWTSVYVGQEKKKVEGNEERETVRNMHVITNVFLSGRRSVFFWHSNLETKLDVCCRTRYTSEINLGPVVKLINVGKVH
jgi:hypothetical protein